MKNLLKFLLFIAAAALFFSSSLVSYSFERKYSDEEQLDESAFLSAHGLTKDNFSIWLKEHSVWREKYADELQNFSFIPPHNDTEEK